MSRYSSSKFRIALLVLLLGAVVVTVSTSVAQPAPTAGNTPAPTQAPAGLITLIMGHLDIVFGTIALLSIAGTALIIQGFMKNRRPAFLPESSISQMREMISQKRYKELLDYTETDPTFVSRAVNAALKRAPNFSSMKEAMETTVGEQTAEQFRKIEYLNIIGNLGPLLGLLGTVLGMIEAFSAMQAAGAAGASPAQLAGGISTALTHTFLGLMLAIPCLAAFGVLRTLVDRLTTQGALIAEELLLMMKPSEAKAGASIASRPVAAPQPTGPGRKLPTPVPTPSGLGAQLER